MLQVHLVDRPLPWPEHRHPSATICTTLRRPSLTPAPQVLRFSRTFIRLNKQRGQGHAQRHGNALQHSQTRVLLLTLKTAWMIDKYGAKGARSEIAAIKVIAPRVALNVVDRAIQVHGGAGVSEDFPLARMYAGLRTLRIADGPDEVHWMVVGRAELTRYEDDHGSTVGPPAESREGMFAGPA